MDTLCYYNPASDYQMADIAHDINLGASLLNYTAHCTVGGWSHPAMTIGTLDTRTGQLSFDNEAWYTFDGRKLDSKPTQKGVYIHNAKKIVIK